MQYGWYPYKKRKFRSRHILIKEEIWRQAHPYKKRKLGDRQTYRENTL